MNGRARMMGRCGGVAAALLVLAGPAGAAIGGPSPLPAQSVTPTPTAAVTITAAPTTVPPDPAPPATAPVVMATPGATPAATPAATPTAPEPGPTATPDVPATPAPVPVATPATVPAPPRPTTRLPVASTAQSTPVSGTGTDPANVPDAQPCSDAGPNCGIVDTACTILGTPGNDVLVGSPLDDIVCGLAGNDVLEGNGGNDVLVGGTGNDTLVGGTGEDCLLAGPGKDTITGAAPGEPVAGDLKEANPDASVTPEGTCYRIVVRAGATHSQEVLELVIDHTARRAPVSPGPLAGPARTGAFFIAIARLAAALHVGATPLPVALPNSAVVRDGEIRQLLLCPTRVSGTLVYRRHRRRVAAGRFTCTPPSEVVRFQLSRAARSRLERESQLGVSVRAKLGATTYRFQVLLKAAQG